MGVQGFKSQHWSDAAGNPAGGATYGVGFAISWQNGPLGACRCGEAPNEEIRHLARQGHHTAGICGRDEPNGAFVEDVIAAALDRLRYYQTSRFADEYNASAIDRLESALYDLNQRTIRRRGAGVEGTHQVTPEASMRVGVGGDQTSPVGG